MGWRLCWAESFTVCLGVHVWVVDAMVVGVAVVVSMSYIFFISSFINILFLLQMYRHLFIISLLLLIKVTYPSLPSMMGMCCTLYIIFPKILLNFQKTCQMLFVCTIIKPLFMFLHYFYVFVYLCVLGMSIFYIYFLENGIYIL